MIPLALRFLYIGLFSVGGGLSAISLIQAELVDRLGWIDPETLVDLMAIAEMTPGPMAVNAASFVGMRLRGLPGAVTATFACILPGCLCALLLSRASRRLKGLRRWQSALELLRAAVTGLILSGTLVIVRNAVCSGGAGPAPLSVGLFCFVLAVCRRWRPSPMALMAAMGAACGGMAWALDMLASALQLLPK